MPKIEGHISQIEALTRKLGATPESLDAVLASNLLRDILNPDAILRNLTRDSLRRIIELPELLHVDYSLTLEEVIRQSQIQDIDPNLFKVDAKCWEYKYSTMKTFECEDVIFGGPTIIKNARETINGSDGGSWRQVDLYQFLVYHCKHLEKHIHHPIICGQILEIKGVQHIAVLGSEKKRSFIHLMPIKSMPAWPKITLFPKVRLAK